MRPTTPRPGRPADALAAGAYDRDRARLEDALEGVRRALCSLGRQVELCMEAVHAAERRLLRLEDGVAGLGARVDRALELVPVDADRLFAYSSESENG